MMQEHSTSGEGGLLKRGSPEKAPLKSKFIQTYEGFFSGHADHAIKHAQFWDELFLLKVNVPFLEKSIEGMSVADILQLKDIMNQIFHQGCAAMKGDNLIRAANALQTVGILWHAVFRKKFTNFGYDVINLIIGFDAAEQAFKEFIHILQNFLTKDYPLLFKTLSVDVLLVIVTATDNINQNTLVEYLVLTPLFEALTQTVHVREYRDAMGSDVVLLLTLLTNYRKNESVNPYIAELAALTDDAVLNGLGAILDSSFSEQNSKWAHLAPSPAGVLTQISSFVSTLFMSAGEARLSIGDVRGLIPPVLMLYEIVRLNANFVTVLSHTRALSLAPESAESKAPQELTTNLMGAFLTFCSFLFSDTHKNPETHSLAKLALLLLTCVTENAYACTVLHDSSVQVSVVLFRTEQRHRASSFTPCAYGPLASPLLDLCIELLLSHLKKSLEIELYSKCLGVIHRMLCFQKRQRHRLSYSWPDLWSGLFGLLNFLVLNDGPLNSGEAPLLALAGQVVNIFNLFITFGDTFLPDPSSYDALYYELVRVHTTFDALFDVAKRHSRGGNDSSSMAASRLAADLVNIRAITNHFIPKIDQWKAAHSLSTLSPDQVLAIIKEHYDTLTLKLQDQLDHFEKYNEHPTESAFLTSIARSVVVAHRSVPRLAHPLSLLP